MSSYVAPLKDMKFVIHELAGLSEVARLPGCEDVSADLEVRLGQPADQIIAAARDSKCDSIMLSTRGLTGLDRYLIGSVADRVARLAPCPVVLLRPGKLASGRQQNPLGVLRLKHKSKAQR